ncbi:MAG: hypothetical protein ACYDCG_06120 [Candidatus Acidiferrales bacterium]
MKSVCDASSGKSRWLGQGGSPLVSGAQRRIAVLLNLATELATAIDFGLSAIYAGAR